MLERPHSPGSATESLLRGASDVRDGLLVAFRAQGNLTSGSRPGEFRELASADDRHAGQGSPREVDGQARAEHKRQDAQLASNTSRVFGSASLPIANPGAVRRAD